MDHKHLNKLLVLLSLDQLLNPLFHRVHNLLLNLVLVMLFSYDAYAFDTGASALAIVLVASFASGSII